MVLKKKSNVCFTNCLKSNWNRLIRWVNYFNDLVIVNKKSILELQVSVWSTFKWICKVLKVAKISKLGEKGT